MRGLSLARFLKGVRSQPLASSSVGGWQRSTQQLSLACSLSLLSQVVCSSPTTQSKQPPNEGDNPGQKKGKGPSNQWPSKSDFWVRFVQIVGLSAAGVTVLSFCWSYFRESLFIAGKRVSWAITHWETVFSPNPMRIT